ncbi:MAG TPA: hypothetical protein VM531_04490 [Sphingomicrobium sp.]|jgi:hypothetical protein|nr:hypothetical protein [Sphingomicrobium sp.]
MTGTIKTGMVALLLLGSTGTAYASTQGTFGATSTGSVNINASVPARVRISGLTDVDLTNSDPSMNAAVAQNVCVWSNTATRGYRVTATGSGAANAFTLANGALPVVPYTVEWSGTSGQSIGTSLTTGSVLAGQTSSATVQDCSAGPASSASLIVRVGSSALQAMPAATTFTGTLTLVVAPE